jgi:hypothetical protein
MIDRLHAVVGDSLAPLSMRLRVVVAILFAISIAAGIIQGFVIRRALRDAPGLRRFAGWGWDIRMLKRSYYPASGQHLHPTIVRLYAVSMIALLGVFLVFVRATLL